MASGRVYCLLISTSSRHVVYERFYDSFSEPEKGEIRGAFDQLSAERGLEAVGRYKCGGPAVGGGRAGGGQACAAKSACGCFSSKAASRELGGAHVAVGHSCTRKHAAARRLRAGTRG